MAYLQRHGINIPELHHHGEYFHNEQNQIPKLQVVKGDLFNTLKRVERAHNLLVFTQSIFWPERNFLEEEQQHFNTLISDHFIGSKDIDKTFRELIERTCLAKRWQDEKPYRIIAEPEEWFNIHCLDGLYFTHALYNKVLTQRKTIPSYQLALTIMSEAILRYCEKKNVLDIYNYREQFIRLHRIDLLQIYFNAVMHIQFINL